jgi:predicted MFS family arabinose efflux permease
MAYCALIDPRLRSVLSRLSPTTLMLAALTGVAAMSQAMRTMATVVAPDLTQEFGLTPDQLSRFAGAFHLSFGIAQIPVGVALDLYGTRRTVSALFALAVAGTALCALAPGLPLLVAGQLLIGLGCAPAFVGTLFFVSKRYPADQFAKMSGLVLSFSGIGLLATGTPLAWVVQQWSWRAGFGALCLCALLVLVAVLATVRDRPQDRSAADDSLRSAIGDLRVVVLQPHTAGIVMLALVGYASYIALRGLWAAPLFISRHAFDLTEAGHILLAASIAAIVGPILFGFIRAPADRRRRWLAGAVLLSAAVFGGVAVSTSWLFDSAACVVLGLLTGFAVLQFADVKDAYPSQVSGRAFGVLNTAAFLGVAIMQWLSGRAAAAASNAADGFAAAFAAISVSLIVGCLAFLLLPRPNFAGPK